MARVDLFCAAIEGVGKGLKKQGKQLLLPRDNDLINDLNALLERMEERATTIPRKSRKKHGAP